MPETPSSQQKLAAPAILPRRVLRVRGTSVTLIEEVRARAAQDLGVDVVFEVLDFPTCQHSAATDPDGYDIYEQCFHNLDIVWFWGALQPIQIERIGDWDRISSLAKLGGISKFAPGLWRCAGAQALCPARWLSGAGTGPDHQHVAHDLSHGQLRL